MTKRTIGIMGCLTCNSNMGCSALTYTLLQMLEKLGNRSFDYIIYDIAYDENRLQLMCRELGIDRDRIQLFIIGAIDFHNLKKTIKTVVWAKKNIQMIKLIKKCNLVIDLTQGDSFTDIYGLDRFYQLTSIKIIVQKLNIPLILGPQTYGPFEDKKVRAMAKKVIERSAVVISRDYKSKEYLESFCDADVKVGTDLAFGLKYREARKSFDTIKVGLNISGLLHSNRTDGSQLKYNLKTNYDEYIRRLLDYFHDNPIYEVHLIAHVGNDANAAFANEKDVIIHDAFESPIEAKSLLAEMDIFIGARMHATIGAFSAGVATIPVGYSRKFSGLFENLGYRYVVDLVELDTNQAVQLTIDYIEKYKMLEKEVESSQKVIDENYAVIEDEIMNCLNIIS